MKKYSISLFGFILALCCYYFFQKSTSLSAQQSSKHNLFKILDTAPQNLSAALENAARNFQGNPEGFFKYMDQREPISRLNILLYTAAIGDIENLNKIFTVLEKFYGNNTEQLFKYLNTRNEIGRGLLLISILINTNKYPVAFILDRVAKLLKNDKELFLKFLIAADYTHGWNAMHEVAYNSRSAVLEFILNKALEVLGKDSEYFSTFINAANRFGETSLDLAKNQVNQLFLKRYGAKKSHKLPGLNIAEYTKIQEFGKALIEATNRNDTAKVKYILKTVSHIFKNEPHMLFEFLSVHDDAGWNAIIHVVADNQIEYLKMIFNFALQNFKGRDLFYLFLAIVEADINGRTALNIAVSRKNYEIAKMIIEKILEVGSDKRPLIFALINNVDELNGFTILINAAFNNNMGDIKNNDFIRYLVTMADKYLGRHSRMFNLFINAQDYNNTTALFYIIDPALRTFMKSYGATETPPNYFKELMQSKRTEEKPSM